MKHEFDDDKGSGAGIICKTQEIRSDDIRTENYIEQMHLGVTLIIENSTEEDE